MMAAVMFILYAVSAGNLPDFTALGAFESKDACVAAAHEAEKAIGTGEDHKMLLCLSSDSLRELASENEVGQ